MKTIIMLLPTYILISLTGCVSNAPKMSPEMQAAYEKPLICKGEQQCDLYWEKASFYINSHSRYKIQTSNKNLIQTYSPTGGTTSLGYNISREPFGNEEYRIWVKIWCDNMFGCYPDKLQEIANFKIYVGKKSQIEASTVGKNAKKVRHYTPGRSYQKEAVDTSISFACDSQLSMISSDATREIYSTQCGDHKSIIINCTSNGCKVVD